MAAYVRPTWTEPVFRDADGRAFTYGGRWGADSPPEETYSVDSHPERFAPLHAVADALVEHLVATYAVGVSTDPSCAQDLVHGVDDTLRAVRLTPAAPDAAPLTFVWTAYPGVVIHAGVLHDLAFPACGCDACDETAASQADEMENHVLAVTTGHYREAVRGRISPWLDMAVRFPHGSATSSTRITAGFPWDRLAAGRRRLGALPGGWRPWPLRAEPT